MNSPDFKTAVGKLLDYVDLKNRIESFSKFEWEYPHNNKKLNPTTLAEAGFIRGNIKGAVNLPERDLFDPIVLGPEDDTVTCVFCFKTLYEFEEGDKPWTEHKRAKNCPFMCNVKTKRSVSSLWKDLCQPETPWSLINLAQSCIKHAAQRYRLTQIFEDFSAENRIFDFERSFFNMKLQDVMMKNSLIKIPKSSLLCSEEDAENYLADVQNKLEELDKKFAEYLNQDHTKDSQFCFPDGTPITWDLVTKMWNEASEKKQIEIQKTQSILSGNKNDLQDPSFLSESMMGLKMDETVFEKTMIIQPQKAPDNIWCSPSTPHVGDTKFMHMKSLNGKAQKIALPITVTEENIDQFKVLSKNKRASKIPR